MKKTMVLLLLLAGVGNGAMTGSEAHARLDGYAVNRQLNRTSALVESADKIIEDAVAAGKWYVYVPTKGYSNDAVFQAMSDLRARHFFVDGYYHNILVSWN